MKNKTIIITTLMILAGCPGKKENPVETVSPPVTTSEVQADAGELKLGTKLLPPGEKNETGETLLDNHGALVRPGESARN